MTRDQALQILHDNMQSPNLRKHCYAVGAVMKALAQKLGGNSETWEIAGLLHDADYEKSKDNIEQHTKMVVQWIDEHELPSASSGSSTSSREIKDAILAHGWGFIEGNLEPKNKMEWSLYCCDELTGFIISVTLIRPDPPSHEASEGQGKKLKYVTVDNILKKWNKKDFAAGVHREQIELCEEKLGIPLKEFVEITLTAMQEIHTDLDL